MSTFEKPHPELCQQPFGIRYLRNMDRNPTVGSRPLGIALSVKETTLMAAQTSALPSKAGAVSQNSSRFRVSCSSRKREANYISYIEQIVFIAERKE